MERLQKVMAEENIDEAIEIIDVETEDQAQALRFVGSPTIIINGEDIDPPPIDAFAALTCRVYHWSDGRFSPLPSPDMIRNALQRRARLNNPTLFLSPKRRLNHATQ